MSTFLDFAAIPTGLAAGWLLIAMGTATKARWVMLPLAVFGVLIATVASSVDEKRVSAKLDADTFCAEKGGVALSKRNAEGKPLCVKVIE